MISIPQGLECLQKNQTCHYGSPICKLCSRFFLSFLNIYEFRKEHVCQMMLSSKVLCLLLDALYHIVGSKFAINCGGSELSTQRTTYDLDNENLTAASYYVAKEKGWAVSNVGIFIGSTRNVYTVQTHSSITSTGDDELFKSARTSPSSLRYYGFGLENGNYTVKLRFSETQFEDTNTYRSFARRNFHIYIQVCMLK